MEFLFLEFHFLFHIKPLELYLKYIFWIGLEKAKLQTNISDVKFVNDTEADSYRCNNCSSIAIYHYMANCSHLFCGKCHGQYYNKHCPVDNCKNTAIKKVRYIFQLVVYLENYISIFKT